ncbi:hypothetical protein PT974_00762 [Cladobotryum mycophilum]|uniref:Uncharacterized protein n=1 Tax=Cladobotryum mycophilum TaxID=491253 RepID=A0ABR0T1R9_9HYPO
MNLYNPFRPLPNDESILKSIRDLTYISYVMISTLWPASLPDDDFRIISCMLQSLETRTDMTWLALEETEMRTVMETLYLRRRHRRRLPREPFHIRSRIRVLHKHWENLILRGERPQRNDPAFDTKRVPPLISLMHPLGPEPFQPTAEQAKERADLYNEYRTVRDFTVEYYRHHPIQPMGYFPWPHAPRMFSDTFTEGSPRFTLEKLEGNRHFLPYYPSIEFAMQDRLLTQRIPGERESDYRYRTMIFHQKESRRVRLYQNYMRRFKIQQESNAQHDARKAWRQWNGVEAESDHYDPETDDPEGQKRMNRVLLPQVIYEG